MYDMAVGMAPAHLKGHPLTPILGKSFVMYWRLLKMYQTSVNDNKKLRDQLNDREAVEPDIKPGGGAQKVRTTKPGEIDPDEVVNLAELND